MIKPGRRKRKMRALASKASNAHRAARTWHTHRAARTWFELRAREIADMIDEIVLKECLEKFNAQT